MFTGRFFIRRPLGMNLRNFLIREANPLESLHLVKEKTSFKRILQNNDIPTPQTYDEIHDFSDLVLIGSFPEEFVIKPNRGFGGKGIILLRREGDRFVNPSGDRFSDHDLKRHIRKILDGDFSGYIEKDIAIIEERIYPSERLQFKNAYGLPDIRVLCFQATPIMAMLRYPTFQSKGKANLAAGGIGIGIDVDSGRPNYIHFKGTTDEPTLEDLEITETFVMPKWEEMKDIASVCSRISNLGITGVDLILDANDRIRVLEVNGRPGLEIQNINERSLLDKLNGYLHV
ncbi:MAG: hypothetical protein HY662_04300 [Chloroflexi bacterium]|nr:hypothetical protein [Chloroflexota bacterium]